jgi:CheY-like chemotaxis protein
MNGVSAILIVEDHPLDLDLTRAFARRELANPHQVARDGQEALDFIERWDTGMPLPAVILLDLKLPRVSGLEVLRRIKKHPRFQIISV